MNSISELTIQASQQVLNYGIQLLDGISPELFSLKPVLEGRTIQINPPAFQYGHLCLYPARICGLLNLDDAAVKTPAEFTDLFIKGCVSYHDPENKIYPAMDVVTKEFLRTHTALFEILKNIGDQEYYKPNQEVASKDRFPSIGAFIIYLLTAHINTHFGQVCAWRRCVGLPGV
jgi:hypothetical protein